MKNNNICRQKKITFTIRISPRRKMMLERLAESEDKTMTQIIEDALDLYFSKPR